jgi:hypothetical protein
MGFLDYAWTVSPQKDNQKVKILQDEALDHPLLAQDKFVFNVKLPKFQKHPRRRIPFFG